jgi:undecaprenyl-diphosphatase
MNFFERLRSQIKNWDRKLSIRLNGIGGTFLTYALRLFSFLGRETIWLLLIAFYIFIWLDPFIFINIGSAYLIGLLLIVPIKTLINRERPFREITEIRVSGRKPSSGSFPSWHAYNIVSQSIIFLHIFSSPFLIPVSFFLTVLVCFSRVQLGVHYISDVIMGILIGLIGGFSTITIISPFFLKVFYKIPEMNPELFQTTLQTVNPLLFHNILYFSLCVVIFGAIILLGSYKFLQRLEE